MATASDLLEEVNAAISACLTSQEYTSRGLAQKRARLAELMAARRELQNEINESAANGGSMSSVGQFEMPE